MLLVLVLFQIVVGLAAVVTGLFVLRELGQQRREATRRSLLMTFGPVAASAQEDPRRVLAWYPIAMMSRKLFPDAFRELDAASGSTFPFTKEHLHATHARCTADWLAWERAHDTEYSLKAATLEDEIAHAGGQPSPLLRTRLAALEREKLERYQQRYQEYIEGSKALKALME